MTKTVTSIKDTEFMGTKRDLESRRRRAGATINPTPRYRTLSMDAMLFVDQGGTVYLTSNWIVVGQCVPS